MKRRGQALLAGSDKPEKHVSLLLHMHRSTTYRQDGGALAVHNESEEEIVLVGLDRNGTGSITGIRNGLVQGDPCLREALQANKEQPSIVEKAQDVL